MIIKMLVHTFVLMGVFVSCTKVPIFPENNAHSIHTTLDYMALLKGTDKTSSVRLKMAGRIVRAEKADAGYLILVLWLPYPANQFEGPVLVSKSPDARFYIYYAGDIDEDGRYQGNEMIAIGFIQGTYTYISLEGLSRDLPILHARCLHIWKTAGTELADFVSMDPLGDRYPPPLEQTYCVKP